MWTLSFLVRLGFTSAFVCCVHAITLDLTMVTKGEGVVTFTATPDVITGPPWFLSFVLVGGTAEEPADYQLMGSSILSNTASTFKIEIFDSPMFECDRQFVVNFTTGFGFSEPLPQEIPVIIKDDCPVEFEQPANMTVSENIGKVNITIERKPATTRAFELNVFTMGTAEEGVDYNLTTALPLTFAANETEAVLSIYIYDDLDAEPTESICFYFNTTDSDDVIMKYLYITDDDTPQSFHCLRASQDCKNGGTCNYDDFTCDCPMGYEGEDCGIATEIGSEDFTLPTFLPLTDLDKVWQEILFQQNETLQQVQVIDPYGTVIPSGGTVCIYVPDHHHIPDNNNIVNFHCGRSNSQPCLNYGVCENKECTRPGGLCTCQPGFEGVNCGISTDLAHKPDCPLKCEHGVCVSHSKFPYCVCDPGYTGGLCDKDAYYHKCTAKGFHICITPFSLATFGGAIYVPGHKKDPDCILDPVEYPPDPYDNIPDWCTGYVATIPFNSSCGKLGPTVNGEVTSFRLKLLVQYGKGVVTCTDERVTLTCQFNKEDLLLYKTLELDIEGLRDIPVINKVEDFAPVSMTLEGADGSPLRPPLPVGFKLDVCIYTMEALGYEGVVINSVLVNNTRHGDDYHQMYLYNRGCVSENVNSILSLEPYWTSGDKLKTCFQFKVFFFTSDLNLWRPTLGLVMDISLVTDRAEAVKPVCTYRTKRQAVAGKETTVSTVIEVSLTDSVTEEEAPTETSPVESRPWMMPVLYSAGGVFLTLAIVLIVVVLKLRRRSRKKATPLDEPRVRPIPKKFY